MPKYTEGVCADGAGIMKDGWLMPIEQVLKDLNGPQAGSEAGSECMNLLSAKRFTYIKKLVSEIEEQVDAEMVDIDGDNCIPSKWVNVSLLCSVIKKEILRT